MKWVSKDMAWVVIDGHKLLAQLQSSPGEGAHLTFVIKQLTPDILLKELYGMTGVEADTVSMAGSFETARTLFENRQRPQTDTLLKAPLHERIRLFVSQLETDDKLRAAFTDALICARRINSLLDARQPGQGHVLYQPWLVPAARRQITLVRSSGTTSHLLVEFEMSELGMIRIDYLHKAQTTGYRLKVQHAGNRQALRRYLASRHYPNVHGTIDCLEVGKLPQRSHGGILAELLFTHK